MKEIIRNKLGKPKGHIPLPRHFTHGFSKDMFCIQAKGNGMKPVINSGDYLFCSMIPNDQYAHDDVVILSNGVTAHCKFLVLHGETEIYQNGLREVFDATGYERVGKVVSKFGHIDKANFY